MKKFTLLCAAMVAAVMTAKAEVEFAYDAGAEIVSSYIWRGQYNGGLSFQPDLEIGYDGEHTSLRAGVWANIGASDWGFRKGLPTYTDVDGIEIDPNTRFMPELDVVLSFSTYGLTVGFNHYYYCDGSNFFSWQKDAKLIELDENGDQFVNTTSTTEVWAGYNFGHFFGDKAGAYINWYTTVAGNDFVENEDGDLKRAWSSYFEVGYDYTFEGIGLTLGGVVGMSPWQSDLYGNGKFAVTNISLKINEEWELDHVTFDLFAQASLNPDGINKENVFIKGSGDEKLYNQKLNGVIGLGIWF